jgi:hypothetical protein
MAPDGLKKEKCHQDQDDEDPDAGVFEELQEAGVGVQVGIYIDNAAGPEFDTTVIGMIGHRKQTLSRA